VGRALPMYSIFCKFDDIVQVTPAVNSGQFTSDS
jgi:hypothetical protein